MSVTDISQKFDITSTSSHNHLQMMYHSIIVTTLLLLFTSINHSFILSNCLNPSSEECSTLLVLVNKKEKTAEGPLLHSKKKKWKSCFLHWLGFLPHKGKQAQLQNLLRLTVYQSQVAQCGLARFPTNGSRAAQKTMSLSARQRALLICFIAKTEEVFIYW